LNIEAGGPVVERARAPARLAVILSEAKNLSVVLRMEMTVTERFFASLRMTPGWGGSWWPSLWVTLNLRVAHPSGVQECGVSDPRFSLSHWPIPIRPFFARVVVCMKEKPAPFTKTGGWLSLWAI